MALPVWQATIVNEFGDIIPSATMTIIVESTGLPATLWQDRNGTIPLGSNGVFNAGTDGFAQFYADPNEYRVKAEQASSGFSKTWDFVVLSGSAATRDTGSSSAQVPLNSDLPEFGTAAEADLGEAAGNALPASSLPENGGDLFNNSNFQPLTANGIGITWLMQNNSGGLIASGALVSGPSLKYYSVTTLGALAPSGLAVTGNYRHVSPFGISDQSGGYFTKES